MSGLKARIHTCILIIMNNWSVHKAFEKATKERNTTHLTSPLIHIYDESETIPLEAWEDALIKSAKFVERLGTNYLPIFERVECELENAKQQLHSLEKAKTIARENLPLTNDQLRQQSYLIEP